MKNGMLEQEDALTLKNAYKKIGANGMTTTPLTTHEQVLIFCIAQGIQQGTIPTLPTEGKGNGKRKKK